MTMVQVSPQHLLLSGWPLTNAQVNITIAIYDAGYTLIYITLLLLFMFFILLPFFWAGWLSSIPFVCYIYYSERFGSVLDPKLLFSDLALVLISDPDC